MGWADNYIKQLQEGKTIKFRPRGNSMRGLIQSGELVTVEPIGEHKIKRGDIVMCKVKGRQFLHLVKNVQADRFLIGNNRGHDNGWTKANNIFGVCTNVEIQ